jgi:serine/threonine protein kinase
MAMEFLCQFELREILGKGSFGEVKRCIDKRTKADYAVKELQYRNKREKRRITNEVEVNISYTKVINRIFSIKTDCMACSIHYSKVISNFAF